MKNYLEIQSLLNRIQNDIKGVNACMGGKKDVDLRFVVDKLLAVNTITEDIIRRLL
jgi:hypothetical protein